MTFRTDLTNDTANTKPTDGPILSQFNSLTNLAIYTVQTYLNIILLPPCGAIQRYRIHGQILPLAPTHPPTHPKHTNTTRIKAQQAHRHKVYTGCSRKT